MANVKLHWRVYSQSTEISAFGVKRKCAKGTGMSPFDPKLAFAAQLIVGVVEKN